MNSQNLDKLSEDAKDLIALIFTMPSGWTYTYMVEVKLDNPIGNLLDGGSDVLTTHGGNGSKCYAKHWGSEDWAIVHVEDDDWVANPGNSEKAYNKYILLKETT